MSSSWDRKGLKSTKTGKARRVPIPNELAITIKRLEPAKGFVFSENGGASPITCNRVRNCLVAALEAIGVSRAVQKERGLGLHAFRHWLNTSLRGKVSDDTIRALIGHTTAEMTELYTAHSTETLSSTAHVLRDAFEEKRPCSEYALDGQTSVNISCPGHKPRTWSLNQLPG